MVQAVLATLLSARRALTVAAALACGLLGVVTAGPAQAGGLDLHLERLATAGEDTTGKVKNANYEHLMRELSLAFGPRTMGPAASLGPLGIEAAYEYGMAGANASADYWRKTVDAPTSSLITHGVHVRKGLPFSAQLGTFVRGLQDSNMLAIGAELSFAVIDGFKNIPDVAIGGTFAGVLGFPANSTVDMAIAGWHGTVSKSFGIAGLLALQPWVSYTGTFTYVNTHQILTVPHAGYISGSSELTLFDTVKAVAHRGSIGVRFVMTRVQIGGEFTRSFTDDLNIVTAKIGAAF